jgi:hypothetical protein
VPIAADSHRGGEGGDEGWVGSRLQQIQTEKEAREGGGEDRQQIATAA